MNDSRHFHRIAHVSLINSLLECWCVSLPWFEFLTCARRKWKRALAKCHHDALMKFSLNDLFSFPRSLSVLTPNFGFLSAPGYRHPIDNHLGDSERAKERLVWPFCRRLGCIDTLAAPREGRVLAPDCGLQWDKMELHPPGGQQPWWRWLRWWWWWCMHVCCSSLVRRLCQSSQPASQPGGLRTTTHYENGKSESNKISIIKCHSGQKLTHT